MTAKLHSPVATWLILVVATLLSYVAWIDPERLSPAVAGSAVILIAMAKAWLIGMRFMELESAVLPLRIAYNLWVVVVGAVLLAMFAVA
ncbi:MULTISPECIES: cytochrome C oxidase subunit IV family protein [Novosphingobium]|jgi:hypothetical protein|uniref:cytochrome C oxidase subunit IV family protein n=1 Tax=Novosphingobium TaxID=165696 RepID=UPI00254DD9D3|nr:cytochrome C oxidase subunit IV family protein [Novosphingobium sp. fls2-241-R2A-195]MEE4454943.1 cytochrome C oxidase subunit IV family protein [Novosphingobium resinovorum]